MNDAGKAGVGQINHYVVVRSIADGPVVRMQSESILRGLQAMPASVLICTLPAPIRTRPHQR